MGFPTWIDRTIAPLAIPASSPEHPDSRRVLGGSVHEIDLDDALAWARTRKHTTLITLRSDGRPQSSDVVYALGSGDESGTFRISVTDTRAKTANMRRDPRVVLHISEPTSWSYLSFDATVELSETTTSPGDATSDDLCALYEAIAGEAHGDWDEYRAAMVAEQRLVARVTPRSVVGQLH